MNTRSNIATTLTTLIMKNEIVITMIVMTTAAMKKVLDGWMVRVHDSTTYCTRIRRIITQINSFERLGRKNYVAGERKAIADFLSTNQQIEARIVDH